MATELRGSENSAPVVQVPQDVQSSRTRDCRQQALIAEAKERPDRALDRAVARGMAVREEAKQEEGGHISADEAARMLGISKTSILKKFEGQLLGWRSSKTEGGPISGLAVCRRRDH